MKPNTKFSLTVTDIDTIERALFLLQTQTENKKDVVNLLAKIFHQKNWYRPKKDYVSG